MRRGTAPLHYKFFRSVSPQSVASSDFGSVITCGACGFQRSIKNCCILTPARCSLVVHLSFERLMTAIDR